jgi:acyl-CoA synthetase (AMP-forming)/AMP-acid ligase II
MTYEALLELTCRMGSGLRRSGIARDQRVVVAMDDGPWYVATFLGCVPHERPRFIEFVDTLPKTPTGKILRYQLR